MGDLISVFLCPLPSSGQPVLKRVRKVGELWIMLLGEPRGWVWWWVLAWKCPSRKNLRATAQEGPRSFLVRAQWALMIPRTCKSSRKLNTVLGYPVPSLPFSNTWEKILIFYLKMRTRKISQPILKWTLFFLLSCKKVKSRWLHFFHTVASSTLESSYLIILQLLLPRIRHLMLYCSLKGKYARTMF